MTKPIFLIGYMCSGKTTLGRALSCKLGVRFIDLDDLVEEMAGKTIPDIFSEDGESHFRALERQALERAANSGMAIVACGGGTPCVPGAIDMMKGKGCVVYLRPSMDRLVERMAEGKQKRPLLSKIEDNAQMEQFAIEHLKVREPYYSKAHFVFDSSFLETNEEISQSVNKFIKEICQYTTPRH